MDKQMKTVIFDPRWYVDVSYSRSYNCEGEGCACICRCSTIEDAKVESVSLSTGMFSIFEPKETKHNPPKVRNVKYKPTAVELYCLDRLLRIHKAYDAALYTPRIVGGYYGQETDGADFEGSNQLQVDAAEMVNLSSDIEKIKFVLLKEYTHILDLIKDTTDVVIEELNPSKILKNDDYAIRVKNNQKKYEFAEGLPVGVVYRGRLIDGYNRFASLKAKGYSFIVLE